MSRNHMLAALLALAVCSPAQARQPSAPAYAVTRTVALGAPDRWDYVTYDPPSHRVYVAHGDRLTVVDGRTGAVVGQVEGAPGGTHGTAVVTALGRGYTDDGEAGVAKVFDLKTFKMLKDIAAQPDADGVVLDRPSGHIFVLNGDSGKVTIVDPKTDQVISTIDAGGKLEFGVSGENGKFYVEGAAKREIVRIDTRTNAIDAKWSIAQCESPHGLAIDTGTHRLFASCVNSKLVVIDAERGTVVAVLPIGQGSDAVAFDPKRRMVFSSNGRSGDISVIKEVNANTFVSVGSIPTKVTARTMSIDPASGRLYVVAGDIQSGGAPGPRPKLVPGSLKLLFLDPTS